MVTFFGVVECCVVFSKKRSFIRNGLFCRVVCKSARGTGKVIADENVVIYSLISDIDYRGALGTPLQDSERKN